MVLVGGWVAQHRQRLWVTPTFGRKFCEGVGNAHFRLSKRHLNDTTSPQKGLQCECNFPGEKKFISVCEKTLRDKISIKVVKGLTADQNHD